MKIQLFMLIILKTNFVFALDHWSKIDKYFNHVTTKLSTNRGALTQINWETGDLNYILEDSENKCQAIDAKTMNQKFHVLVRDIDQNLYLFSSIEMQKMELLMLDAIKSFSFILNTLGDSKLIYCEHLIEVNPLINYSTFHFHLMNKRLKVELKFEYY